MEPRYSRLLLIMFLTTGLPQICGAQNGVTVSVFTVTSKSVTVRWAGQTGASSVKVTATPKNWRAQPVFAQFSGNTVIGSVTSLAPNTVYTVRVEAMDASGNVLSSAETDATTAPDIPFIIQAYSKRSDSITVEFTNASGATSYILRAENDTGFFFETVVQSSPGTVQNLSFYSDYTLSVMSVNSGGRSQPSYPVNAKTVMLAPVLRSTAPTNDTITVTWDPVAHAVLYTLCIIMDGSNNILKFNTTQTNMTFNSLEAGVVYYIKGMAWDSNGIPGDDNTIYQITRPPTPDGVQVFMDLQRFTGSGLDVIWRTVQGADLYFVWSSTGQNCSTDADPFCTISPINCSQSHLVSVTAQNQAGSSGPSEPQAFVTYPCSPDFVNVREQATGNCSVSWAPVQWVDYYMTYIKRDDGAEIQCNTTTTTCYYTCPCSSSYFISVFANNKAGPSAPGITLNYTTVPCCPENVSISLISVDTLEITWSAVKGTEIFETLAVTGTTTVYCSDTVPLCVLSDLTCNSVYSVVTRPCSETGGCNDSCPAHIQETAPCTPDILSLTLVNSSSARVVWSAPNSYANYTATAVGNTDTLSCWSNNTSCDITTLLCGATYQISVYAANTVGRSLPSYSVAVETGPCCPDTLSVEQVTQAMTRVAWSSSSGAQSYIAALTSPRGQARCHTMDSHCLMGCITCGTNYSVSLEAVSSTGHKTECSYYGFSSSACCPSNVRLYRMANSTLRLYWRASDSLYQYSADVYGTRTNYTCSPTLGSNTCSISEILCGDLYTVVVAPVTSSGLKVAFCPKRLYSVSCSGNSVGMVIYRGKRSAD
ncbi:fibronectin type III domain-containing protein 7 [Brachyhypopomus gauderio]|uniref:fibronectin type III domain-containing protein 7 n=1 Tax=Brachyhypopomus gauderio TaxID=698409 RepID=UPI004041A468